MDIKKTIAISAAAAVTTGAVAGTTVLKMKRICPLCEVKKLAARKKFTQKAQGEYNNGTCLTPPMGWSCWNLFNKNIEENMIKEMADAMVQSGMLEAGYNYLNIDDCWQASERDIHGALEYNKLTFPNGIKSLATYANDRGLKLGLYSCNGSYTCENYPGSLRHEAIDADTMASWGIEYFKYDYCHNEEISYKAPQITSVTVSTADTSADVIADFKPSELKLSGQAKIAKKAKLKTGEYMVGLDSNLGKCNFEVTAPKAGQYILTIGARKQSYDEKFMIVNLNGEDKIHMYAPKIRTLITGNKENYLQTTVSLKEGVNSFEITNPVGSKKDSAAVQYKLMGQELKRASKQYAEKTGEIEKPIVYSICEWGVNSPHLWGSEAGNLWRTTHDIGANWASILGIYEFNSTLYKYATKGGWNDPDMLEVGLGSLTYEENKSHFSLWCMMAAPLILGNDIRAFIKADGSIDTSNKVYQILTNKDLIAIDQDELGMQCRVESHGTVDVLVKPLADAKVAICVFNKGNSKTEKDVKLDEIANLGYVHLPKKDAYTVKDAWSGEVVDGLATITAKPEKHGVCVYIVE
ncbi:MAG: alpha-galactosidase [Clostridia bacterium]